MVTTNKPRPEDDFEDEEDVAPLADSDVPADVLAEFDDDLEAAVANWGDALEAYLTNKQRTSSDG